jgi:hypothetical protein
VKDSTYNGSACLDWALGGDEEGRRLADGPTIDIPASVGAAVRLISTGPAQ